MDDQRVGRRDVEAAFDDGGRQQHVIALVVEGAHPLFHFRWRHLAVGGDRLHFRHLFAQELFDISQIGDARHHEEALPAAIMFAQQRFADHYFIERAHIGPHGEAIDRRGGDDRHFAQAGQCHLQRARDWRGGEREHVHIGLERLQAFLMNDAKALLFVDNNQSQPFEFDRFGQHGVGADDDIHCSVGQAFATGFGVGGIHQPRQVPHFQRKAGEAFAEALVMLPRQQGGGAHHRHLHPGHGGSIGRAQGDFGLAEADIAAHQPIHRAAGGEIVHNVTDGFELIIGFGIGEAVNEGRHAVAVDLHRFAFAQRACRRGGQQFAGNLADAVFHPRLARAPGDAAQFVEADAFAIAAVTGEDVDILDRHIQLVAAVVGERHAIMRFAADGDGHQPVVAADAVIAVDDQIAGREHRQFCEEGIGLARRTRLADQAIAQHVLLGEQGQRSARVNLGEAVIKRQHGEHDLAGSGEALGFLPVIGGDEAFDAFIDKQAAQPFARAVGVAGQNHPVTVSTAILDMGLDRGIDRRAAIGLHHAFRREIAGRHGVAIDGEQGAGRNAV